MVKISHSDFIEKAKKMHKDKFDYSQTVYINSRTKVDIICKKHGKFSQLPLNHLRQNCPNCAIEKEISRKSNSFEDFKKHLSDYHINKYDYSKMKNFSFKSKEIFICPIHGEFIQTVKNHIESKGCYRCGREETGAKHLKSVEQFISNLTIPTHIKIITPLCSQKKVNDCIDIHCDYHGKSSKILSRFIKGFFCNTCGKRGFSRSNFLEMCKIKKLDKAIFYIIRLYNENESFYKYGITSISVTRRFKNVHKTGYNYEIVKEEIDTPLNTWNKENKIRKAVKNRKYQPKYIFPGYTECYK